MNDAVRVTETLIVSTKNNEIEVNFAAGNHLIEQDSPMVKSNVYHFIMVILRLGCHCFCIKLTEIGDVGTE